jgi:SAM-dependent methyltransferase
MAVIRFARREAAAMSTSGVDRGAAHREIVEDAIKIRKNTLLEEIYKDIYSRIVAEIPADKYPRLLELGSGGGFFRDFAPHCITSECVDVPGIDRVVDACRIGDCFAADTLDAVAGFNVFHHLPHSAGLLSGVSHVLRRGGRLCLVEPWFTPFGQWFYRAIHHEPSVIDADDWSIVGEGRLNGANSRLPTSVFRDSSARFAREFPELAIIKHEPFHKWLYLASGGLRLNTRVPRAVAKRLVALDRRIHFGNRFAGLFALIVVERRG